MNKGEKKVLMYSILLIIVTWIVYKIFSKDSIEGQTNTQSSTSSSTSSSTTDFDWKEEDLDKVGDAEWENVLKKIYGDNGQHYRGNVNKTIDGIDCIDWDKSEVPIENDKTKKNEDIVHIFKDEASTINALGDKEGSINYCRNFKNSNDILEGNIRCMVKPGLGKVGDQDETKCKGQEKDGYKWDPKKKKL